MQAPRPPQATKHPKTFKLHGKQRTDNYHWLRDKTSHEVIDYLKRENDYTEAVMKDTESLQEQLFEEMKSRIKETDTSEPDKIDDHYYYYERTVKGKSYPIFCRKKYSLDNEEEVLLDQNELAGDSPHCSLDILDVSPDHNLLAYSIDKEGSEKYTIYIKDMNTGEHLTEEIGGVGDSFEWMNDSATFLYTSQDKIMRPSAVYMHTVGDDSGYDTRIFNEADERFYVTLHKSKSKQYIFIEVSSAVTSELHFMDANGQDEKIHLIHPREHEHIYQVEHHGDSFFIMTNDNADNFRLVKTPIAAPGKKNWQEVIPHRQDVMLEAIAVFQNHVCISELSEGVTDIRIWNLDMGEEHYVKVSEEVYSLQIGGNPNFGSTMLRLVYSSLTTPVSIYDYDMNTGTRELVKQFEVLGGYSPDDYAAKRVYAQAADGSHVPISLVHRKDISFSDATPCYLTGYGACGMPEPPDFVRNRINLLERGFVVAIAHVRGGCEKGRQWYEDGKYLKKKNTFNDFINSAEHLIEQGYTSKNSLVARGGSAGGLLIGAVLNERPDLFRAAVADVPFVDTLNTMLDPSLPLTVVEREEWGDPSELQYYEYIESYSPYENVGGQDYPHLLVATGLNDQRVSYWEPAKWVAKLREMKTDDNMLLLKTNMNEGHTGASGRYSFLHEIAFRHAFILKALDLHE